MIETDFLYGVKEAALPCPYCDAQLDGWLNVSRKDQREPRPLDFTVCAQCMELLVYDGTDDGLYLRKPTGDELEFVAGDPDLVRAMRALDELKQVRAGDVQNDAQAK